MPDDLVPPGSTSQAEATEAFVAMPVTETPVHSPLSCREKAVSLVHKYAAFGTAFAVLPIPMGTSAGLTALETHMIYWIARVYGEDPSPKDVVMIAGGLELASLALRTVAVETANLVPVVGWGVKGAIAGSAIKGIGTLIIDHFESKYPGKRYGAR